MPTKNPRINVTFEEMTINFLSQLAYKERKSLAAVVRDLVLEALDAHEDLYLSKIAEKVDKADAKTYSHEDAWK